MWNSVKLKELSIEPKGLDNFNGSLEGKSLRAVNRPYFLDGSNFGWFKILDGSAWRIVQG